MKKFFLILLYLIGLAAWVFGLIFFIPVIQDFTACAEAENFFLSPVGRFLIWEVLSAIPVIAFRNEKLEELQASDSDYNEQHKKTVREIVVTDPSSLGRAEIREKEVYTTERDHYGIVVTLLAIFSIVIAPFDLLIRIFKTLAM